MALLIENYLNEVQLAGGINTNKPATFARYGNVLLGGRVNNYISNSTSTTLTAAQSGTTVIFNQAAGITYTLPAPQVGLSYNFKVLTSVTSLTDKIITSGGAFLIGPAIIGVAAGTTTAYFGDGSTIVSVNMNGTTTGGTSWLICQFYLHICY